MILPFRFFIKKIDWAYVAQAFAGLFFIGLGIYKIENYFLIGDLKIADHFQFWIDNGYPPSWWVPFLEWGKENAFFMAEGIVLAQFIAGFLLLTNIWVHLAAFIILIDQTAIFLSVLKDTGFNDVAGLAVWVGLFYIIRPNVGEPSKYGKLRWQILTLAFIALCVLHLYNRYQAGDPWTSEIPWHIEHLQKDAMSITVWWKNSVIALGSNNIGAIFLAGRWWTDLIATFFLITPLSLFAAGWLLVTRFVQYFTWFIGGGPHPVLWILTIFIWITNAHRIRTGGVTTRRWGMFFLTISLLILTTMIAPHMFGMKQSLQWGGVYTDFWCEVRIVSDVNADLDNIPETANWEQIRSPTTRGVWYSPMHGSKSCIAWARSFCDIERPGYIVKAAFAWRRGMYLLGKKNVCDLPLEKYDGWFRQ
jgi:hypothetical protein